MTNVVKAIIGISRYGSTSRTPVFFKTSANTEF